MRSAILATLTSTVPSAGLRFTFLSKISVTVNFTRTPLSTHPYHQAFALYLRRSGENWGTILAFPLFLSFERNAIWRGVEGGNSITWSFHGCVGVGVGVCVGFSFVLLYSSLFLLFFNLWHVWRTGKWRNGEMVSAKREIHIPTTGRGLHEGDFS